MSTVVVFVVVASSERALMLAVLYALLIPIEPWRELTTMELEVA